MGQPALDPFGNIHDSNSPPDQMFRGEGTEYRRRLTGHFSETSLTSRGGREGKNHIESKDRSTVLGFSSAQGQYEKKKKSTV